MNNLFQIKSLLSIRTQDEINQINALHQCFRNLKQHEGKLEAKDDDELSDLNHKRVWEETKCVAIGLRVNELEKEAGTINLQIVEKNFNAVCLIDPEPVQQSGASEQTAVQSYVTQSRSLAILNIPFKSIRENICSVKVHENWCFVQIELNRTTKKLLVIQFHIKKKFDHSKATFSVCDDHHIKVMLPKEDSSEWMLDDIMSSAFFLEQGLAGLYNLGNTCYMNSALQALSNCVPLTSYFLDCIPHLIKSNVNEDLSTNRSNGKLVKAYAKLIQSMWIKQLNGRQNPILNPSST